MTAPAVPPDDALRAFLLGTLPADRADEVRRWLDSDRANADRLASLLARDPLTDAVTDRTADAPVPADAVERVVRGVSDSRRGPTGAETSADGTDGGTIPQFIPPVYAPAWPPARLGQFRVVRELGHGGMGYVFEAEDETLGRRVAVKVLAPELTRQPGAGARFLREARAAAKVEHDNVVPVLHVGEDAGTPFMVMPLLRGESLADRLKRSGALSAEEVSRVGRDVAAGLAAAHAKGLVHRDLKPGNVWLDAGTGRARVLDFGLARSGDGSDALTHSGALTGTPAYMAPELTDGKPATVRSDLFALGAVLYECATGRRAFEGPTITAILKAVSDHHPTPPAAANPAVPAELSALVMRLLSKNPADRPASAAEVLASLGAPPPAPDTPTALTATWTPDGPNPAAPKARAPRQIQIGCVVTVSLCLVVSVGWLATRSLDDRKREVARGPAPDSAPRASPLPQPPFPDIPRSEPPGPPRPAPPVRYRGHVDVKLARTGDDPLMRLNLVGALPMRPGDTFRVECEVDPPAYLYLVWIDPGRDVTPMYPWDPTVDDWRGTRPVKEEPRSKVSLPADVTKRWTVEKAKPGVVTVAVFACEKPLDVPDAVVEKWFKDLPELPTPRFRPDGVMWFENYRASADPLRAKFGEVDADAFSRWQGELKRSLAGREVFQTSVIFTRTGKGEVRP